MPLSPAAQLTLQELEDQPRATGRQRLAVLQVQVVVLVLLYCFFWVMLKVPWFGRGMSKIVKLSRRGPLYKLGVWVCRRLSRVVLGRRAYAQPTLAPAVGVKRRAATIIEVKVVAARGRYGNRDDVVVESRSADGAWTHSIYDAATKTATVTTAPGASVDVRAKASNVRGAGPWSQPLQARALLQPNAQHGGDCGDFSWRQTPETVTCVIEVPRGTTVRDVVVDASNDALTASLKAGADFFDGAKLLRKVAPAGTAWGVVDNDPYVKGTVLTITLEKAVATFRRGDHWDRLFTTGPRVDTSLLPLSLPSISG